MALLAGVAALLAWQVDHLLSLSDRVTAVQETIADARQIERTMSDLETSLRGYLLSGDASFMRSYANGSVAFELHLDAFAAELREDPAQLVRLARVRVGYARWQENVDRSLRRREGAPLTPELATEIVGDLLSRRGVMDAMREEMTSIVAAEQSLGAVHAREAKQRARRALAAGGGSFFVLGALLAVLMRRQLRMLMESYERALLAIERHAGSLARSEARFRRLFEANVVGVLFTTTDGRILDANDAALDTIGYSRAELAQGALRWDTMTPPEHREADARALRELAETGIAPPREKSYTRKDGRAVPVLVAVAMLEHSADECVAFVVDLTQRKRLEEELSSLLASERAARVSAEEAIRIREAFIATASHELHTPVTTVQLQIESLLRRARTSPEAQLGAAAIVAKLTEMETHVDRLIRLMHDLLDASRLETSRSSTQPSDVDVQALVEEIGTRFDVNLRDAGCALAVDAPHPVHAWVERARLDQTVTNLVSNAIKFCGGRPIRISILREGADAVIAVRDEGIGIAPENHSRIFERFERVTADPNGPSGFGLGLWIARELVTGMGGRIRVTSALGHGSTFEVRVPAALGGE